jgi:hypothetical protein
MAGTMGVTLQADLLKLVLNGVAKANMADNAASSPLANLYVSLHTSDPTNAGNQTSSEISYTGYARVAVARNPSSPAWTVSGTSPAVAVPTSPIVFGTMTGGTGGTATYAVIGTASSGTGELLWKGAISPSISVVNGVAPPLGITTSVTMD